MGRWQRGTAHVPRLPTAPHTTCAADVLYLCPCPAANPTLQQSVPHQSVVCHQHHRSIVNVLIYQFKHPLKSEVSEMSACSMTSHRTTRAGSNQPSTQGYTQIASVRTSETYQNPAGVWVPQPRQQTGSHDKLPHTDSWACLACQSVMASRRCILTQAQQ